VQDNVRVRGKQPPVAHAGEHGCAEPRAGLPSHRQIGYRIAHDGRAGGFHA
jgi:hypothetical protein